MDDEPLQITPRTKVADLLHAYPALEEVLIEIAPAFKKLRNPILRRTVARVTSLAQAARVGEVPVGELVQRLRREVGQPEFEFGESQVARHDRSAGPPPWLDRDRIVKSLDARPLIEAGEPPIGRVLEELETLSDGEIYELVTPFEPAPLIDRARARGCSIWTEGGGSPFRTYFMRGHEKT